jgi:K+-sensing histidine kinase KdpD
MMSVTHEFKSPLAAIKLSLQTIQKRKVEEEMQQQLIMRALMETDRINALVENILMSARIEAANLDFTMTEFNLSDCISSYSRMREFSLKENKKLIYKIEDGLYMIGDALAIGSLFMNLIDNADKYAPPVSQIFVSLFKKENYAHLEVADVGSGVADSEKRKIFEKFYRVGNEETRKTKGTGLGLYIARFIAVNHRAKISVRNNIPKGSIFEVVFPLSNTKQS